MTARLRCPVHCGYPIRCTLVLALDDFPRELVDQAVAEVAETYTREGVDLWWKNWLRKERPEREALLHRAMTFGGMVAT